MHLSIRKYKVNPHHKDDLIREVEAGFVPLISQAPGFIAFYVVDAGDGDLASISIFDSHAAAEESNRLAAGHIRENLATFFPSPPDITAGEVRIQARQVN